MLQEHSHKMELMLPCSSETFYDKGGKETYTNIYKKKKKDC